MIIIKKLPNNYYICQIPKIFYMKAEKMKLATKRHFAFTKAAMPLIKYLAENRHPHCTAVVTSTGAELMEGLCTAGKIMKFIDK